MLSIRQKIIDELKRRLAAIKIADGYETDLGLGPISWWPIAYQAEELPALGIHDVIDNQVQEYAQQKRIMHELACQVRIYLPRDADPAVVLQMLADVQAALITDPTTGQRDATLGGLAVDMQPTEAGFVVAKETYQIDAGAVGFNVQFLSEPFNAYQ
jgi:hypothetical protein